MLPPAKNRKDRQPPPQAGSKARSKSRSGLPGGALPTPGLGLWPSDL